MESVCSPEGVESSVDILDLWRGTVSEGTALAAGSGQARLVWELTRVWGSSRLWGARDSEGQGGRQPLPTASA